MVRGMPCVDHIDQLCDTCVVTKLKRRPFPRQASYHATEQLELVHGDLCGPVSPATLGGWCYFLLLVDDATHYMWAVLLDSKAAVVDTIKSHQAAPKNDCGRKLWVLCTDNGGELMAAEFAAYCVDKGIQRHYLPPNSSQQNGMVKHRNQTVVVAARAPQEARHASGL